MNKIEKFLSRLSRQERAEVQKCVENIIARKWADLDIKKLKGYSKVYRVRLGSIRTIFISKEGSTRIITIERRSGNTYRNL